MAECIKDNLDKDWHQQKKSQPAQGDFDRKEAISVHETGEQAHYASSRKAQLDGLEVQDRSYQSQSSVEP